MVVRARCLHPLGDGHPRLVRTHFGDSDIAEAGAVFGNEDLFAVADDMKFLRIDPRDEEGSPMTHDVVVAGTATRVDQKERVFVNDPMLLHVVVSEIASVVEGPLYRFGK